MEQKSVQVYRIEYEVMPDMTHFTAFVAAVSHEESIQHIYKIMRGKKFYISTSGVVCPLHDLTATVRRMIAGVGPREKTKSELRAEARARLEAAATAKVAEKADEPTQDDTETRAEEVVGELKFKSGRGRKPGSKKA